MLRFFRRIEPNQRFWNWFLEHDADLLGIRTGHEPICQELLNELQRINEHLTWEVGPHDVRPREFIISADGIREAFFSVEALADAAPPISNWRVVRFRPRKNRFEIRMSGRTLGEGDVLFTLHPSEDGVLINLVLYVRGCEIPAQKELIEMVYLLLDGALGEYDMETKVGWIEVVPLDRVISGQNAGSRLPLSELPAAFDAMIEQR